MEVLELQPLIWATTACSQSVCPRAPYGRGSSGHIKGGMASNPHTMNTRENQKRASSAKRRGCRWALLAVPVGAGGRPHSVGIRVTSSFSWAGSGVLDGCEVGADRRKNRSAWNNPSGLRTASRQIQQKRAVLSRLGTIHIICDASHSCVSCAAAASTRLHRQPTL